MSQFYQGVTAGALPPVVPTTFQADFGTAIPAANILNVFGGTGIETTGSGNTLVIKLENSGSVTTQTIGATSSQAILINLGATPSVGVFVSRVVGFDAGGSGNSAGYFITAAVKTDGATATVVNGQAKDNFEDAAFSTADANVTVTGNSAAITVTGVAGFTIDWTIETTFTAS